MCAENEQNNETDETATSSEINTHSQVHTNTFHKVSMTCFFKGKGLWCLRNILQKTVWSTDQRYVAFGCGGVRYFRKYLYFKILDFQPK